MGAWQWLIDQANDKAFFSSLFGALMGAWAAAALARSENRRERQKAEVLACNIAIGHCASIFSSFVNVKVQAVGPISQLYRAQWDYLLGIVVQHNFGAGLTGIVGFQFDLRAVPVMWTAIESLNATISEGIRSTPDIAVVAASLTQAVHNYRAAAETRNGLLSEFYGKGYPYILPRYFGLAHATGIDQRYPDTMRNLENYTNDVLYYCDLLGALLTENARHIIVLQLGEAGAMPAKRLDTTHAPPGLMPAPEQYPDYEKLYRPKNEPVVTM